MYGVSLQASGVRPTVNSSDSPGAISKREAIISVQSYESSSSGTLAPGSMPGPPFAIAVTQADLEAAKGPGRDRLSVHVESLGPMDSKVISRAVIFSSSARLFLIN